MANPALLPPSAPTPAATPDPLAGLMEVHMDPNTGENERALAMAASGAVGELGHTQHPGYKADLHARSATVLP